MTLAAGWPGTAGWPGAGPGCPGTLGMPPTAKETETGLRAW